MLNSEAQLMQHLGSLRHQEEIEKENEDRVEETHQSSIVISDCPEQTESIQES